jgi:hypothetical protein
MNTFLWIRSKITTITSLYNVKGLLGLAGT